MWRLIKRHCQTVRGTIVIPWISERARHYPDHSRFIPLMLFDRGVCLVPALRKNLTNLFEIVWFMFGVPLRPKTGRLAFGPPNFQDLQIFWGYGGSSVR